jgi:hypothetical protein
MTLKDAYEDHIENEKFSKIVKENLRSGANFTDGFIAMEVIDLDDHYMEPEDHGHYFDIVIWEKKTNPSKKVFFLEFNIDITYNLFGLILKAGQNYQYIDPNTIFFWLMADNFVCIYWAEDRYAIVELSEFIKLLKNPIKFVKSN